MCGFSRFSSAKPRLISNTLAVSVHGGEKARALNLPDNILPTRKVGRGSACKADVAHMRLIQLALCLTVMLRLLSCPRTPTSSAGVDPALGLRDSSGRHIPPSCGFLHPMV